LWSTDGIGANMAGPRTRRCAAGRCPAAQRRADWPDYFGETVDTYEDGVVTGHEGSWLVGGATAPGDPPGTANAAGPNIFMPATPEVGDVFKPEDLAPVVDETDTVKDVDLTVQVPAGKFHSAIRITESTPDEPDETKWYAAGVGVLKGKTKGEAFTLQATTIAPPSGP